MTEINNRLRHRCILGKHPVMQVTRQLTGYEVVLEIQSKLFLTMTVPLSSDVRVGDLLTLYTEVLVAKPKDLN